MKTLFTIIFAMALQFKADAAQTPEDVIRATFAELGAKPGMDDEIIDRAVESLNAMPGKNVTQALFDSLTWKVTVLNQEPSIFRIGRKLANFDMPTWLASTAIEKDPYLLDTELKIASNSSQKNDRQFLLFLHKCLADKREGRKVEGEGRAYARVGLRVCDEVLNILLWMREPEATRARWIPLDPSNSEVADRDQMIAGYCKKYGVTFATSPAIPQPSIEAVQAPNPAPSLQPPITPSISSPSPPPQPSLTNRWVRWAIIAGLLVFLGVGLRWRWLRKE